jgi:hypothetical protein
MQLPEEITKCAAFVLYKRTDGLHLAGTAFYVGVPIPEIPGKSWIHMLTARHVIKRIADEAVDGRVRIRVNTKSAAAQIVETEASQWLFHPTDPTVDIAMLPGPPTDQVDYVAISTNTAATPQVIEKEGIGVGDEVFLTGLFANHYGYSRNLPIVRVGNVALLSDEPVQTEDGPMNA